MIKEKKRKEFNINNSNKRKEFNEYSYLEAQYIVHSFIFINLQKCNSIAQLVTIAKLI